MSHSQFHSISLYLDMHGLIFETSIWLLAESTRFYFRDRPLRSVSPRSNACHIYCNEAVCMTRTTTRLHITVLPPSKRSWSQRELFSEKRIDSKRSWIRSWRTIQQLESFTLFKSSLWVAQQAGWGRAKPSRRVLDQAQWSAGAKKPRELFRAIRCEVKL